MCSAAYGEARPLVATWFGLGLGLVSHLVRVDVGDGAYHGQAGGTPRGTHATHLVLRLGQHGVLDQERRLVRVRVGVKVGVRAGVRVGARVRARVLGLGC
eukprot:scaffold63458_cov60-Phaeocystis_antarctica.AAC.1